MKNRITDVLLKDSSKWQYWLFIAFAIRLLLFIFKISIPHYHSPAGFWGVQCGDTPGYLDPIDNFIKSRKYMPDDRMPGYGVLYFPLTLLFSKTIALNLLLVLQLILSAVGVYLLALIAKKLFKENIYFYLTFYLYAISTYTSIWDQYIATESFTTSFMIIYVYCFISYFDSYSKIRLLFSGLFITWVMFLRPVFCLLVPISFVFLLVYHLKHKLTIIKIVYFLIPFIIFEGGWIVRNYISDGQIAMLAKSRATPSSTILPVWCFVEAWGGNADCDDPTSEIHWFGIREYHRYNKHPMIDKGNIEIPDYVYTSKFNKDSLESLRTLIVKFRSDSTLPEVSQEEYLSYITKKFNSYTQSIKEEKPILYWITSHIILVKRFLIQSGTNLLFNKLASELNIAQYCVKIFCSLLYILTIIFGCIGILLMSKNIISLSISSIVAIIPLYDIFMHPIIFRLSVNGYFVPAYPFMLVCAIYCIVFVRNYYKRITS